MSVSLFNWLNYYIEFISFEFQSSHFLITQHAEVILCRNVVAVSSMNDIQFQSEDHQLMLLNQQQSKMQDNLIYRIEDFWENLHAVNSESETSSESLCKQDFMISRSCDSEISWLTVMWSESWQKNHKRHFSIIFSLFDRFKISLNEVKTYFEYLFIIFLDQ